MEPKLSEIGIKEFDEIIGLAKARIKSAAEDALSEIYTDLPKHIETDAWANYRNDMQQELAYANGCLTEDGAYWARNVRAKIFEEHRDKLVELLNKDLVAKVKELEERLFQIHNRGF